MFKFVQLNPLHVGTPKDRMKRGRFVFDLIAFLLKVSVWKRDATRFRICERV